MLAARKLTNEAPMNPDDPYPYRFFVSDEAERFTEFANSILPVDVKNARIIPIEEY